MCAIYSNLWSINTAHPKVLLLLINENHYFSCDIKDYHYPCREIVNVKWWSSIQQTKMASFSGRGNPRATEPVLWWIHKPKAYIQTLPVIRIPSRDPLLYAGPFGLQNNIIKCKIFYMQRKLLLIIQCFCLLTVKIMFIHSWCIININTWIWTKDDWRTSCSFSTSCRFYRVHLNNASTSTFYNAYFLILQ